MSKSGLKKAMRNMSRDEIVEMVLELYDARREAKDYLDYWVSPTPDKALDDTKAHVEKMFFYSTGKNRKQPSATDLKNVVKDFSTLVFDSEKVADLLLLIGEYQLKFAKQKKNGFMQSEGALMRALGNARTYIEGAALESLYGLRLERLAEQVEDFLRNPPAPERRHRGYWYFTR